MKGSSNAPKIVHSNKNLLDNWDFTNPVNQRGQSTYTGGGYTIDRWRKIGGMVSINSDRLNLSGAHSSTSYIVDIRQLLDSDTISAIAGKTVTLSVDCAVNSISGEFYISLANDTKKEYPAPIFTSGFSRKIISHTQNIPSNWGAADSVRFTIGTNGTKVNADIYAAKLELGEVSTLKNDLLGVSYAEELIKCKRYLYRISPVDNVHTRTFGTCAGHNDTLLTTSILMPDNFRETAASPVLEISDISQFSVIKGNIEKAVTGIAVSGISDQSVPLDIYVASGGIDEGAAYSFLMKANSWIQFSKEL